MASQFIEKLKSFINREQDTQNREIYEMWNQPVEARVAEGEAISNVEVVNISYRKANLQCSDNQSKFRPGDAVRLNRGNPMNEYILCEIYREIGNELIIIPGFGSDFSRLRPGGGWVIDRHKIDVRRILLNTLDMIAFNPQQEKFFRNLFKGGIHQSFDSLKETRAYDLSRSIEFNPSQQVAFVKAYSSNNYYLIQGPPGTGKTWVLAHLAGALAREGQRVLVTAFTHRAINNALVKIAKVTRFKNVFKVGQTKYTDDLIWKNIEVPNYEYFKSSPFSSNSKGMIIGGTCFAVQTERLRDIRFDTVIFDEAGQVTLPLAMAGMLSGQRYVFIGDHQQMPPVINAEHREKWVTRSVFEALFNHAPGTTLNVTYRMNSEINRFPSQQFYEGKLAPSPETARGRLKLKRMPNRFQSLLDPEKPEVFAEINHQNRGMRSPEEAEVAATLVAEAVSCGVSPEEIAVVAPYRAQGRLISKRLQELCPDHYDHIIVDTVERIQGQEKDIVIISLTTSDPSHAAGRANFYFQPNRLNVAITRPRVKRVVIGSPLLFKTRPKEKRLQSWVDIFHDLYQQSTVVCLDSRNV